MLLKLDLNQEWRRGDGNVNAGAATGRRQALIKFAKFKRA